MLLPGYSLTFAITEVTTKRLLCGIIGIFRALYAAALLGLGLSVGSSAAILIKNQFPEAIYRSLSSCRDRPSQLWFFAFFPFLIIGIQNTNH